MTSGLRAAAAPAASPASPAHRIKAQSGDFPNILYSPEEQFTTRAATPVPTLSLIVHHPRRGLDARSDGRRHGARNLIEERRRQLSNPSYRAIAESGGLKSHMTVYNLATQPLKAMPEAGTLEGLARGLDLDLAIVTRAAQSACGYHVWERALPDGPDQTKMIANIEDLEPHGWTRWQPLFRRTCGPGSKVRGTAPSHPPSPSRALNRPLKTGSTCVTLPDEQVIFVDLLTVRTWRGHSNSAAPGSSRRRWALDRGRDALHDSPRRPETRPAGAPVQELPARRHRLAVPACS